MSFKEIDASNMRTWQSGKERNRKTGQNYYVTKRFEIGDANGLHNEKTRGGYTNFYVYLPAQNLTPCAAAKEAEENEAEQTHA